MRLVGKLANKNKAQQFISFLAVKGIDGEARKNEEQQNLIWIYDDVHLSQAKAFLAEFERDSTQQMFQVKATAPKKPKDDIKPTRKIKPIGEPNISLNAFLILICVFLYIISLIPQLKGPILTPLFISSSPYFPLFYEIKQGQIWRLVTPIFMHGDIIHLGFNMLWMFQLGKQVESIESGKVLLFLVIIIAIISNVAQYLVSGPMFLGMSGVVYGLLGYIFIMSRYEMASAYFIDQTTMVIMIGWLFICLAGVFGNVANGTHVAGIISGGVIAFIKSSGLKNWFRRSKFRS